MEAPAGAFRRAPCDPLTGLVFLDGAIAGFADRFDVFADALHGVAGGSGKREGRDPEGQDELANHDLSPFFSTEWSSRKTVRRTLGSLRAGDVALVRPRQAMLAPGYDQARRDDQRHPDPGRRRRQRSEQEPPV